MPELVTDGDCRAIVARTLRLAFRWTGDRWAHALELPGGDPLPIVRSLEGDPDRDHSARVVSPAYQQLEFQERGATWQALLVGQSGPHHFSAVFELTEAADAVEVAVDVADRCRAPIEALACTYLIEALSGDLIDAGPTGVAWSLATGRLDFRTTDPAHTQLAEAGRRASRVQANFALLPGVQTHRGAYQWRWTDRRP